MLKIFHIRKHHVREKMKIQLHLCLIVNIKRKQLSIIFSLYFPDNNQNIKQQFKQKIDLDTIMILYSMLMHVQSYTTYIYLNNNKTAFCGRFIYYLSIYLFLFPCAQHNLLPLATPASNDGTHRALSCKKSHTNLCRLPVTEMAVCISRKKKQCDLSSRLYFESPARLVAQLRFELQSQ